MKNHLQISLILSIFLITALNLIAQGNQSSFQGTRFIVGFLENELTDVYGAGKDVELVVFISAGEQTNVTVKMSGSNDLNLLLSKDEVKKVIIPDIFEVIGGGNHVKKQVEITSDFPIVVYGFSSLNLSSDSYSAIPVNNWGKEYTITTFGNDYYSATNPINPERFLTPRPGVFLIMADEDGTAVDIDLTADLGTGQNKGITTRVYLNKGESYLARGKQVQVIGSNDLTGTKVRSNKPIGILAGHVRTSVLQGLPSPGDSKDHLVEMLNPEHAWGKSYISVPYETSPKGDYFKITVKEDSTRVSYRTPNGISDKFVVNKSDFVTLPSIDGVTFWSANKPFQVAQVMARYAEQGETVFYDPSLVFLPSLEHLLQQTVFMTPGNVFADVNKYIEHSISLIVDTKAKYDIMLDDKLVSEIAGVSFRRVYETDYHWAKVKIQSGSHKLESKSGNFSGIVYGIGFHDSYSFVLGSLLNDIDKPDRYPPIIKIDTLCYDLQGTITESNQFGESGIFSVKVNPFVLKNVDFNVDKSEMWQGLVRFEVNVIDPYRDAYFEIEYSDYAGNTRKYVYVFDAIKLDVPSSYEIKDLNWISEDVVSINITNNSSRNLLIENISFTNEPRLSITSPATLPYNFKSGETLTIMADFSPNLDSSFINTNLVIDLECDLTQIIPVSGLVAAPIMSVQGYDFKDVYLQTTKCDQVAFINEGNIPIIIEGFIFDDKTVFTAILPEVPYILAAGDTLLIYVCFKPNERIQFTSFIEAVTNFKFDVDAPISGHGIAPLVESLVYDWGDRRVGTDNPVTLTLRNVGNADALIDFSGFAEMSHDDDNAELLRNINHLVVPAGGTYDLDVTYSPIAVEPYLIKAEYIEQWAEHPPISITLMGNGTLPELIANDYDFGTINVYNTKSENVVIGRAGGNETLTVEMIQLIGGDVDEFDLDISALQNEFSLQTGETITLPVTYQPKAVGSHSVYLSITHDGNPNYVKSSDTIEIRGSAIAPDSGQISISADPISLNKCNKADILFNISNNGATVVEITNLSIESNPPQLSAELSEEFIYPVILPPGETLPVNVNVYSELEGSGRVTLSAEFFENFTITSQVAVETLLNRITIIEMDDFDYTQSKLHNVNISGSFSAGIEAEDVFRMTIKLDEQQLYLVNEVVSFIVKSADNDTRTYEMEFSQSPDRIELITKEPIMVSAPSEWSVFLELIGKLGHKFSTDIQVSASLGECFLPDNMNFIANLEEFCVFYLRPIEFIGNLQSVKLYPNPIDNKLSLKIKSEGNTKAIISVSNLLGQSQILVENLKLSSGINELEYKLELEPGVYFLQIQTELEKQNHKFIVR